MRTSARWARWLLAASLCASPWLAACGAGFEASPPPSTHLAAADGSLTVVPDLADGYRTQTVLAPYTSASVQHLVLRLSSLTGTAPNEVETTVTDAGGLPVQLDVPAAKLGQAVNFTKLKPNTRYRVRAFAYNGPGVTAAELISVSDAQSLVDVTVGTNDTPIVVQLKVRLRDRNVYAGPVGGNLGLADAAAAAPNDAWSPQPVYNNVQDEYFLVWRDDRFGQLSLIGRRVSRTGAAQGTDIRLTTSTNEADAPAVAFNATAQEYLVVWQEQRGAGTVVVGRRVGADGSLRGNDVVLSSGTSTAQYQPKVAYNPTSQQYLVVWNEFRAATGFDVIGRRIAADGTPVGSDLVVSANANSQEQPALAFNPTAQEFLVVWSEGTAGAGGYDIMGRRVSAAGVPLGSDLTVSAATTAQHQASVAFNTAQQQYLVVWSEFRNSWDIVGRRLASDGGGTEVDLTIASNTNPQYQPMVDANPATPDYMVVYNEHKAASGWDVISRRVPTSGLVTAGDVVVAGSPSLSMQPAIAHHRTSGQALVTWHTDTSAGGDVYTSIVGTSAGAAAALGAPNRAYVDQRSAQVVSDGAGQGSMLAWLDVDQGAPVIRGQLVTNRGVVSGAPFVVSLSTGAKANLTASYNPTAREYLLVWQEYKGDNNWDILARRVNTDGLMLLGPEITVSSSIYAQEQPAVAFSPDAGEYLIVWQETLGNRIPNVVGKRLRADGTVVGADFVLAAGTNRQEQPTVAYHAGVREFLVAWSEKRSGTSWDVLARRVLSGGGVTGTAFAIASNANFQEQPAIAYNTVAQEYLVVWQEFRASTGYDLIGRRVTGAGALAGNDLVIASNANGQEFAGVSYTPAAQEYLVVWQEQRSGTGWDVLGQRLTAAGAAIGQNLVLANAALDQVEPRLAYNPTTNDWLLCFRDGRQSATGRNFDVFVQAIDSFASP